MVATIILGVLIFVFFAYVVYQKFIKKNGSNCHSCDDIGCPLADASKMNRKK